MSFGNIFAITHYKLAKVFAGLLFLVVFTASSNGNDLVLYKSIENQAYHLTLNYFVSRDDLEEFKKYNNYKNLKSIHAEEVTLERNKKAVSYQPIDQESLYSGGKYFDAVWSPDKKYLVLPLGMFEGFVIYRSQDAWENMSNHLYPRIVKVRLSKDDPDLSHEFKGWEGQNTLVFEAGLSETINTYRYNIETGDFKGAAPFEGVVSTSDIKIVVFPKK